MILIVLLLTIGLAMSAFFSGSETGFYRVTRVRLVMDAKSGRWIARALLWMTNHSTAFVATVLIGNNIANYLVSLGLLLASHRLLANSGHLETFLPVLMTPILFIYGELLPKFFYYHLPYRLLNRSAPMLLICGLVFLPVSSIIMLMERCWQAWLGSDSVKRGATLERQELQRVLVEGQEAGVLLPVQREIAQNMFTYGVRPVRQFSVPLAAIPLVQSSAAREEIISQADRRVKPIVGVLDDGRQQLVGYFIAADLLIQSQQPLSPLPICQAAASDSCIQVLTKMQHLQCSLAAVHDASGKTIGIVEKERLTGLLLTET